MMKIASFLLFLIGLSSILTSGSAGSVDIDGDIMVPSHGNITVMYDRVHYAQLEAHANNTMNVYGMLQQECENYLNGDSFHTQVSCLNVTDCVFEIRFESVGDNDVCFLFENHHETPTEVTLDFTLYYSFLEPFLLLIFIVLCLGVLIFAVMYCFGLMNCCIDRMKSQQQKKQLDKMYQEFDADIGDDQL